MKNRDCELLAIRHAPTCSWLYLYLRGLCGLLRGAAQTGSLHLG